MKRVSISIAITTSLMMAVACSGKKGASDDQGFGSVALTLQPAATLLGEVTMIHIDVAPGSVSGDVVPSGGLFSATLNNLAAGPTTFTAIAYAGVVSVGVGGAVANIVVDTTTNVFIQILDLAGPDPAINNDAVITALIVSDLSPEKNNAINVEVQAIDFEGDPLSYQWWDNCGPGANFANETVSNTTWVDNEAETCMIWTSVSSSGVSDVEAFSITVTEAPAAPGTGTAQVSGAFIPHPIISDAFVATGSKNCLMDRGLQNLVCIGGNLNADASATLMVTTYTGASTTAVHNVWDDCGGQFSAGVTGFGSNSITESWTWTTPVTAGACAVYTTFSSYGLADSATIQMGVGNPVTEVP